MWRSVPQTPARRTRIKTSSSRIVGSGTSVRTMPGSAARLTSARTRSVPLSGGLSGRQHRAPDAGAGKMRGEDTVDAATVLAPNTGIRTPRAAVSQHSNDAHLANFAAHVV